ncbi:hypothetical protein HPB51_006596 [Rhipicephalus microplus]|uniref:Uncharacterized protein n=1 Tax=Rhipicephalus microplus TaxID=6941 RepID=A0A9J6E773_RHIMP|nr:hypothetical protein HPB51_006596 [Rhipicephalus microplus]
MHAHRASAVRELCVKLMRGHKKKVQNFLPCKSPHQGVPCDLSAANGAAYSDILLNHHHPTRLPAHLVHGTDTHTLTPIEFGERPLCVHTPCTWLRMYSHEHHRWILRIARRSRSAERSNKEKRISRVARKARGRKNTGGPQLRYMDAVFLPAKRHRAPPAKVCAAVLLMERAVIYHGAFARPSFVGRLFRPPASSLDGESLCADLRRSSLVKGPGSCTAAVACSAGRASSLDAFARREEYSS